MLHLEVKCTKIHGSTFFRQTVDGFVPMFTPKLGADKEFRPIQMTQQQLASIRNTVPSVPEATPSSVAIQNPAVTVAFPGIDASLRNQRPSLQIRQDSNKLPELATKLAGMYLVSSSDCSRQLSYTVNIGF